MSPTLPSGFEGSPRTGPQAGYIVTLTLVLVATFLVIGAIVGVVAFRNGVWIRNETNLIKDSSMPTPKVVGKPVSFNRCETPQVLCPDPGNGLWALIGVRPDRFTSLDRVYYTGPNCTGDAYLAIPGMPPFGNPFPATPTAPFGDAEVVGTLNHLQGVSYGVGAPSTWDPTMYTPNGPGLLYRSTTTLLDPLTTSIASMWDSKALGPCYGGLRQDDGGGGVLVGGILEAGTVASVGGAAVTVALSQAYLDPVVVTTIYYDNNTIPPVTRVTVPNVAPVTSFTVRLQIPSGGAPAAETVSYLVVESGAWQVNGLKLEAQKYLSTVTDMNNSWVGEAQGYMNSYASPAVIGQVMSENDADWSVFWSRRQSRQQPPNSTAIRTGKHVGEDTDITRENEIVGFVVFETGHGDLGPATSPTPIEYETALGPDTVQSSLDSPPYTYTFATAFGSAPSVIVASQSAMDGSDGSWAQLWTKPGSSITATDFPLTIEEDQITGADAHTTEQVAYVAFAEPFALPRQLCNNLSAPTIEPLLLAEQVLDDGMNVLDVYTPPFRIMPPMLLVTPADVEGAALKTATSPEATPATEEDVLFTPPVAEDGAFQGTTAPGATASEGASPTFPPAGGEPDPPP